MSVTHSIATTGIVDGLGTSQQWFKTLGLAGSIVLAAGGVPAWAQAPAPAAKTGPEGAKPNILVIMADDIGVWNISAYHRGMMGGRTPT